MRTLGITVNQTPQGTLINDNNGYQFIYGDDASKPLSITMPITPKASISKTLHPVFQMNLPEGALKEKIKNHFGKVAQTDDMGLLKILGPYLLGRIKAGEADIHIPDSGVQLSDLINPTSAEYFESIMDKFAVRSGISGVQPKVLIEAKDARTLKLEHYIVKSWTDEYPELAANEFFAMRACKHAGLPTPEFYLSTDRKMFVMKRFDIDDSGEYLGFEDMCVVLGKPSDDKYLGSYEDIARALRSIVSEDTKPTATLFKALVMNHLLRNGDAHMKNFGILYADNAPGNIKMAPIYDVITTTIYNPKDIPALNMSGGKLWWKQKTYDNFALSTCKLSKKEMDTIIAECENGLATAKQELQTYMQANDDFKEFGTKLLDCWQDSFGLSVSQVAKEAPKESNIDEALDTICHKKDLQLK